MSQPFLTIDPLLQVSISTLAKRVVEYLMYNEVCEGKDVDTLEKMKADIEEIKSYIQKCRGASCVYETMNWLDSA